MKGKAEWPGSCSQDIIYPALVLRLAPHTLEDKGDKETRLQGQTRSGKLRALAISIDPNHDISGCP